MIHIFDLVYCQCSTISLIWCISQECDNFTCEPAYTCHRDITRAAAGMAGVLYYVGYNQETPLSTGARHPTTYTHPALTQPTTKLVRTVLCARRGASGLNAFWKIQHFCVHQMLMRDPIHQIDLGAIVHLIRAILRNFQECAGIALDKVGLVAKQLRQGFELMLAKRSGLENQLNFIEHVSRATCNL